jgi:hypothetical protein
VVQIVLESDSGEWESDVVEDDMEVVAPPRVTPHPKEVQDLLEVQTNLEANLPLSESWRHTGIELGAIGHGKEQIPERPDVEVQTTAHPG